MSNNKFILGLDLGVGSVGWSCVLLDEANHPHRILDLGSRIFEPSGSSVEDRRIARGSRRVLRRRKARAKRIRNLFAKHGYLSHNEIEKFLNVKGQCKIDPYLARVKGKTEKLNMEELCVILIHYAKGRGFKSNRKSAEDNAKETKNDSDEKKLLFAKQRTEKIIEEKQRDKNDYTITDLLLEIKGEKGRIRNTAGVYQVGITRAMIESEIKMILDHQIGSGLVSEAFKDECMGIIFKQLTFSEGPNEPSPYHNPLQQMIGICRFTKEPRAAKKTMSYELFVLVQKLHDIRYHEVNSREKRSLNNSEVSQLVELALGGKEITYAMVEKVIGKPVSFFGLYLTKSEYFNVVDKMKNQSVQKKQDLLDKEKKKKVISDLKSYKYLRKQLKAILGNDYPISDEQYDLIADCLTQCKSDGEMENYLIGNRQTQKDIEFNLELIEAVKNLDDKDFTGYGKVSLTFLYKILPLMIDQGFDYTRACTELGYNHSIYYERDSDFDSVPIINQILEDLDKTITNKSVLKTLVMARSVVNAIINKYGKPIAIHIEMARELTKSDKERRDIQSEQFDNYSKNISLKYQIYSKHGDKFKTVDAISGNDLLQYRLFVEQSGICPYTLLRTGNEQEAKIHESNLFAAELEIDHIIPYSICFDDRFVNKVLVKKQENQEKSNQTPLQFHRNSAGLEKYRNWVNGNRQISVEKQSRLLADEVDNQLLNDYRARTINDTRYAAKAFKEILSHSFPSIKIRSFTGQITANMRNVYRLNGKTHSLEAQDYKKTKNRSKEMDELYEQLSLLIELGAQKQSKEYYQLQQKIKKIEQNENKKNRENHLHHALDATLIAVATDGLRRKIEIHEMALRQRKSSMFKVKLPVFDEETGEVIELEESEYCKGDYYASIQGKASVEKALFPEPYKDFTKELLLRTYELDKNRLRNLLATLPQYKNTVLNNVNPVFVSHHYTTKISGRLHKATYYGIKEQNNHKILTSRIAIDGESFNEKKLEKIFDKNGTQKYIYETVKEWLDGHKNGLLALKEHNGKFPKNRNGNDIRKVKLDVGQVKEEFSLKEGINQYVEKENVLQVWVYSKKGDDKLYFAGMDRFRLLNIGKREDLKLLLWHGQGENNTSISVTELAKQGFDKKPMVLNKGQTLFIKKRDGTQGLAKLVGCTSGMLEVDSILGDGKDLISSGLFEITPKQFRITVSTIESILPISVNQLGEIKSNYGL